MRITHKVGLVALLAVLGTPAATVSAQGTRGQIVNPSAHDEGYRASDRQDSRPWWNGQYRGESRGRSDLAFTNGYNDGFAEGLNDGRRHHRNNPYAESRYRNADHGFARWYGDRDAYRQNYREAFRRGYERGYSEGWRR